MKDLDDLVRKALRREPPPAGFAGRVLRQAAAQERLPAPRGPSLLARRRPIAGLAAAAALVAAVAGGVHYRNVERTRAERAAGEAAKQQVLEALRLTSTQLQFVQAKVREIGS